MKKTVVSILILIVLFKNTYGIGGPIECKGPNEFWSCGGACQDSCKTRYTLEKPCPIVNIVCNNVCYCLPGFVRDDRLIQDIIHGSGGVECIPEWACNESTPECGGANEEFRSHGSACDSTCAMLDQPCLIVNKKAEPGCYCKKGFARNEWGTCIAKNECPAGRCYQLNEVYTSKPCDKMCGMLEGCSSGVTAAVEGCFCKTGYVKVVAEDRGSPAQCIPEWQCYKKNSEETIKED